MTDIPKDIIYLKSHEWVRIENDNSITIGITDYAQDQLGDIVFIELPELGRTLVHGEEAAIVESVKAASDIYTPISGEVVMINEKIIESPEIVNISPYEEGWFYKMKPSNREELDNLLSPEEYKKLCED
tara:strand:+ start:63 stop:449 length:387 start_codon:yes stop_codon:yes gene_type:complete